MAVRRIFLFVGNLREHDYYQVNTFLPPSLKLTSTCIDRATITRRVFTSGPETFTQIIFDTTSRRMKISPWSRYLCRYGEVAVAHYGQS